MREAHYTVRRSSPTPVDSHARTRRGNRPYRIRLNHSIDSIAESTASTAASAANSAVISVDFFSITSREFSDL